MRIVRFAVLAALPLALSGCFLAPGAFTSTLDLRRDGSFAFAYKGEIVFESPDEMMKMGDGAETWSDDKALCLTEPLGDGSAPIESSSSDPANANRACTRAEIAEQRKTFETEQKAKAEKRTQDARQFGAIFGFTPGDDTANRKLAATYARYQGFRTVAYKGNGVFDVDYAVAGKLTHDLVFPVLPEQNIVFPFVAVRRQADGSARVNAPSLIGGGLRGMAAQMKALGAPARDGPGPSSRTRGSFTITTDGEVLTNNTENGASVVPGGRALRWEIGPGTEKIPEALIALRP